MEAWTAYNISIEVDRYRESEIDRLGRKHGLTIWYGMNGNTDEAQYVLGVRNGLTIERDEGGTSEKMYVGGFKHGITRHKYDDGNIVEEPYINDRMTGLYKRYEDNIEWRELVNDVKQGKHYQWDKFGSLTLISAYVGGVHHGKTIHLTDGLKRAEYVHDKGHLLSHTTWDNTGKLLESHKYN